MNKKKKRLLNEQNKPIRNRLAKTKMGKIQVKENITIQTGSQSTISMLGSFKIKGGATVYQPFELDVELQKSIELPYFDSDDEVSQYIDDCLKLKYSNISRQEQLLKEIFDFLKNGKIEDFDSIKSKVRKLFSIDRFGTYLKSNPRVSVPKGSPVFRAVKLYNEKDELEKNFDPVKWRFVNENQSLMRLNKAKSDNPVLYGSPEFNSVFYEIDAKDENEKLAVFVYRVKKDIELLSIDSQMFAAPMWGSALNEYGRFFNEILKTLFSLNVTEDLKEDLVYMLSNFIKDEYFDLVRESSNGAKPVYGWTYISIKTPSESKHVVDPNSTSIENRCFAFPKSVYKECLDLDNVSCIMVNCDENEKRNLRYCQDDYVKDEVRICWDTTIVKELVD